MNDRNMIPTLLRLFPSAWRSEYGLELSSLLEQEPLSPAIVWNVVQSALYQRVLSCPAWVKAAGVPGCWFLIGLTVNSIWAMSAAQYSLFWNSYFPLEIGLGYYLSRRGSLFPGRDTAYAVFLGSLPMLMIEALRKLQILHPTILDLQGHVSRSGRGFTEFAERGLQTQYEFLALIVVIVLGAVIASAVGWLGGQIAEAVRAFEIAKER